MSKIYVGDVGDIVRLNANPLELPEVDIATANTLKILVKKPDGTLKEWTASRFGETDKIQYLTKEGDFDIKGTYKLQAYVAWTTPASGHRGETTRIKVYEAFK